MNGWSMSVIAVATYFSSTMSCTLPLEWARALLITFSAMNLAVELPPQEQWETQQTRATAGHDTNKRTTGRRGKTTAPTARHVGGNAGHADIATSKR